MWGIILHKIVTKHGLSLGEKADSNKLDINYDFVSRYIYKWGNSNLELAMW